MPRPQFYTLTPSHYCVCIDRALAYKGIAVERVNVPYHDKRQLLRETGQDYVPALKWDGKVVTWKEIPEFLDRRQPTPTLFPPGQEGVAALLESWGHDVLEERVWRASRDRVSHPAWETTSSGGRSRRCRPELADPGTSSRPAVLSSGRTSNRTSLSWTACWSTATGCWGSRASGISDSTEGSGRGSWSVGPSRGPTPTSLRGSTASAACVDGGGASRPGPNAAGSAARRGGVRPGAAAALERRHRRREHDGPPRSGTHRAARHPSGPGSGSNRHSG